MEFTGVECSSRGLNEVHGGSMEFTGLGDSESVYLLHGMGFGR